MFKWIKQLFKVDKGYYAGLPFAKEESESLPCSAMQSEIIANELVGEKQSFSEPVNLIVESLKEEGRWTWEFVEENKGNWRSHWVLVDTKTGYTVKVYANWGCVGSDYFADCVWATPEESGFVGEAAMAIIRKYKEKKRKVEEELARAEVMSLYKKASHAE